LVKVWELFLRCLFLNLLVWYWHTSRKSDLVSPGDWLMSSIWSFFPQISCNWEVRYVCQFVQVVRAVVAFTRWQLHCISTATLVSYSPSKVGGQFSFEYCPLSHEISSRIHHLLHFGRFACHPTPFSAFVPLLTSAQC
jgi:hypothetical protein